MRDEPRPLDYRKVKTSALQALAAGGDGFAIEELERRGLELSAVIDVTTADYLTLRQAVLRWSDGRTPEECQRSRALAERAQGELEVRFTVDMKRWNWQGPDPEPQPPPAPPWLHPLPVRCVSWKRPAGSSLYPSDADRERARFNAVAFAHYQTAGASSKER